MDLKQYNLFIKLKYGIFKIKIYHYTIIYWITLIDDCIMVNFYFEIFIFLPISNLQIIKKIYLKYL